MNSTKVPCTRVWEVSQNLAVPFKGDYRDMGKKLSNATGGLLGKGLYRDMGTHWGNIRVKLGSYWHDGN